MLTKFTRRSYPTAGMLGTSCGSLWSEQPRIRGCNVGQTKRTQTFRAFHGWEQRIVPDALFVEQIFGMGGNVVTSLNHLGWQFQPRCPWNKGSGLPIRHFIGSGWFARVGHLGGSSAPTLLMKSAMKISCNAHARGSGTLGRFMHHDFSYKHIQQNAVGTVRTPNSSFDGATSRAPSDLLGAGRNSKAQK